MERKTTSHSSFCAAANCCNNRKCRPDLSFFFKFPMDRYVYITSQSTGDRLDVGGDPSTRFFRYLADKREMPYLAMLKKVEKWSWIQIRNPVNTKMLPHPDGHPSPHVPSLVDIHGHVRELTCS